MWVLSCGYEVGNMFVETHVIIISSEKCLPALHVDGLSRTLYTDGRAQSSAMTGLTALVARFQIIDHLCVKWCGVTLASLCTHVCTLDPVTQISLHMTDNGQVCGKA